MPSVSSIAVARVAGGLRIELRQMLYPSGRGDDARSGLHREPMSRTFPGIRPARQLDSDGLHSA